MSGHTRWEVMRDRRLTPQAREAASRLAWEERLRVWVSQHVALASAGYPFAPGPIAPEGTPAQWRYPDWSMFNDSEALNIALLRMYGCLCEIPLIGFRNTGNPRCRLCNTDEEGRP